MGRWEATKVVENRNDSETLEEEASNVMHDFVSNETRKGLAVC